MITAINLCPNRHCNVRVDFRIDEEVFRFAFYPLVSALDDHFIEFIRIISAGDEEQVPDLDLSELLSLSEQNDPEAQYQLAIKYYKGEGVEQDLGKAIELFGASLSNGRNATAHTLKECIDDLSCRIKEFSETQDYEKASSLQALIDKSKNLLNLYGKE